MAPELRAEWVNTVDWMEQSRFAMDQGSVSHQLRRSLESQEKYKTVVGVVNVGISAPKVRKKRQYGTRLWATHVLVVSVACCLLPFYMLQFA